MEISGVITIDKSYVHPKGQGHKSRVTITEVEINFAQIWAFPDSNFSLALPMAMKLLINLKVA